MFDCNKQYCTLLGRIDFYSKLIAPAQLRKLLKAFIELINADWVQMVTALKTSNNLKDMWFVFLECVFTSNWPTFALRLMFDVRASVVATVAVAFRGLSQCWVSCGEIHLSWLNWDILLIWERSTKSNNRYVREPGVEDPHCRTFKSLLSITQLTEPSIHWKQLIVLGMLALL